MRTIQFKVDNSYVDIVLTLLNTLNNLKLDIIKDLLVIDNIKPKQESDLEILDRLFEQSNNKIMVTRENAIDTEGMMGDISRY
jgi:phage protein D